jgi:hypothetical protein
MQAEKHLFATTPLLGSFIRKRAVERLFSSKSREAAVKLAGAVEEGHPDADAIFHRLLLMQHSKEPVMHSALWNYWKASCWLQPQDNIVAAILMTRLPGSLEESTLLDERVHAGAGAADQSAQLQHKLLHLLRVLQGYFLRGLITVDSNDDATEKNAVETEELTDAEW